MFSETAAHFWQYALVEGRFGVSTFLARIERDRHGAIANALFQNADVMIVGKHGYAQVELAVLDFREDFGAVHVGKLPADDGDIEAGLRRQVQDCLPLCTAFTSSKRPSHSGISRSADTTSGLRSAPTTRTRYPPTASSKLFRYTGSGAWHPASFKRTRTVGKHAPSVIRADVTRKGCKPAMRKNQVASHVVRLRCPALSGEARWTPTWFG